MKKTILNLLKTNMQEKTITVEKDSKVLVVSDVHLGLGEIDKTIRLFNKLKNKASNYDTVILNGDTLETWKYDKLGISVDYRKSKIKKLFNTIPGLEEFLNQDNVHVILGNHDYSLCKLGFNTVAITLRKGDKLYYITHGNNCDEKTSFKCLAQESSWWVVLSTWLVSKVSEIVAYFKVQNIEQSNKKINNLFYTYNQEGDKMLKYVTDLSIRLNYYGYDAIVVGHTHKKLKTKVRNKILYYNTGTYSFEKFNILEL